jgi:hypothetical protein
MAFVADVYSNTKVDKNSLLLARFYSLLAGLAHPEQTSEHKMKELIVQIA